MSETIKAIVDGGAASAGPPLGPALGPLGVNTGEVVKQINEKTANFKGMKIPIEVIVDATTKEFEIVVGSPPTSALILKALGLETGGGDSNVGDLNIQQIRQIAKDKQGSILAKDLNAAVNEVAGTCQSLKITIEGRTPKDFIRDVHSGRLNDVISGKTDKMPEMTEEEKKHLEEQLEQQKEKHSEAEAKAEEKAATAEEAGEPKEGEEEKPEEDKKE